MKANPSLQFVKEIREVTDIKEVAQLLNTGEWLAVYATINGEDIIFCLGRVELVNLEIC